MSQQEEPVNSNTTPQEIIKPNIEDKGKEITKQLIRRRVWENLEKNKYSSFPRPVYNRIPNFKGCEAAALKLLEIEAFKNCKTVEVNPDKPQEFVRVLCLENDKNLYVPVPRLTDGLLKYIRVPENANNAVLRQAVSRKGIEDNGAIIGLNDKICIDVLILGSVAVSREGYRIGKGRGYADLEYAILREMNAVDENTIIITNVHDSQVFDSLPKELFQPHDVPLDYIVTPTEVIHVKNSLPKPAGIIWNLLSQRRVNLMPILQALKEVHDGQGKDATLKETDTDVESYEPRRFSKFRNYKRRRPNSTAKSDTQGEGDAGENVRPRPQRRHRYFHRRRLPLSEERSSEKENIQNGEDSDQAQSANQKNQRPRRSAPKHRPQIDFSLMVSNIEKTVRIRDLKNALIEKGIKPNDITWRGYRGFCFLHYAKPNAKTKTLIEPRQVDSVIEILQSMKISPDSETNLNVKVMEPISRIETTDVTAV